MTDNNYTQILEYDGMMASPVEGRVTFGWLGYKHHKGLSIRCEDSATVHAAFSGQVILCGTNLIPNHPELSILIRSENGEFQFYSGFDRILVWELEHVSQGEIIGYAGGARRAAKLYFETWTKDRAQKDPMLAFYLHGVEPGSTTGQEHTTPIQLFNTGEEVIEDQIEDELEDEPVDLDFDSDVTPFDS